MSVRAGGGLHVCRGELCLARDAASRCARCRCARSTSLFARVFDMLRSDLAEDATVAIDLLPASPQQRLRLRKRLLRQADRSGLAGRPARSNGGSSLGGILHDAARELGIDRGPRGGSQGNGRLSPVDPDRLADRAQAVIDSFAVAAGWTGRGAPRTTAILTNAVNSLLYLALQLPPNLQPTIFTIPRLLLDEDWRTAAVTRLPEHLALF